MAVSDDMSASRSPLPISRAEQGNQIIASLTNDDRTSLEAILEPVDLAVSTTVGDAGAVIFPDAGVVTIRERGCDVAIVGRDGALGALPGGVLSGVVRIAGRGRVARMAVLRRTATPASALAALLDSIHPSISAQLKETCAAERLDPAGARIAGWLLRLGRLTDDRVGITHDRLAGIVGVRRATVTDQLHLLEGEHAVRCTRGLITIIDADALAVRALAR